MYKKGQFFLLAAAIIVIGLIGLAAVYNRASSPKEDYSVYDLSNQIEFEGTQVIDSAVFNSLDSNTKDNYIENLTNYYSQLNPDSDILVVYGNGSVIYFSCNDTGSTSLGQSRTSNGLCERTVESINPSSTVENVITIKFANESIGREFQLRPDNNFYIILKKEKSNTGVTVVS
jgi:hypothetical protein